MNIILVKQLYRDGTYVGTCTDKAPISCDQVQSGPRSVWLRRKQTCCAGETGIQYELTFKKPLAADGVTLETNALVGMWIDLPNGKGVMVDATQVEIQNACRACCDTEIAIVGNYAGGVPAMTLATALDYCITRADDGGQQAVNKAGLDYFDQVVTLVVADSNGTTTHYHVTAYSKPTGIGADTVSDSGEDCS